MSIMSTSGDVKIVGLYSLIFGKF